VPVVGDVVADPQAGLRTTQATLDRSAAAAWA
jgi:hypothetical protein